MATMMRRTQSWTPTANAPPAGHKLRRSSQSLPADLALRRSVISFSTDFTVHQPDAPALQRVMPTIRVEMAPRIDPAERRGVSLIVERANRRQARVITHTLTVDAWLLTLLLLFTFVGSSSGLMLPARSASRHTQMSHRTWPAHQAVAFHSCSLPARQI